MMSSGQADRSTAEASVANAPLDDVSKNILYNIAMSERNKSPETFRVSERNAERVLRQIQAIDEGVPPILVGIDGAGGSGKSTLARQLGDLREVISVVHMDDFYRPMDEATRITLSPQEGYMRYFDWERLRDEVLTPLSMGKPGHYQRYDWPTERVLPEIVPVEPNGVVIVEGVYSLRPELAQYFDLTVFVETAQAVYTRLRNGLFDSLGDAQQRAVSTLPSHMRTTSCPTSRTALRFVPPDAELLSRSPRAETVAAARGTQRARTCSV